MLYIIGIGTHSDVILGLLKPEQDYCVLSMEDFFQQLLSFHADDRFICALGDNEKRRQVVEKSQTNIIPSQWINAVHVSAIIAQNVKLGVGNVVCAGAVIQTHSEIGNHCIINTHCSIDHHCRIADFVHIAPNVAICGSVKVGEGSFVATSASIMPKLTISPWEFIRAGTLVKHSTGPIPMYQPWIKDHYAQNMHSIITTGALTSATPFHSFVKQGEEYLCQLFQVKHSILMNNGTSATHGLFLALRFKYPHLKKIYLPNHVYVAVWNTALYEYDASQLEILPVDPKTLNMVMEPDFLQTLEPNSALVVVHNVGNIVNVPLLRQHRPDLILVEDNCEGLFGKYGSHYTGTQSFCSSASFFANKTITCGEGGAFLTNDTEVYNYIRKVYSQGITSERYVHDVLGYNYRITNLQAALLYPQLLEHSSIVQRKKDIFHIYRSLISHPAVVWPETDLSTEESYWMVILRIRGSVYEQTFAYFTERFIETRPFFYSVHKHKHLQHLKIPEETFLQSPEWFMIPSYPTLQQPQLEYICRVVNQYADNCK